MEDMYQVYVRALNADGKWDSVNVLDLSDESFKRFVLYKLVEAEIVAAVVVEGNAHPVFYHKDYKK